MEIEIEAECDKDMTELDIQEYGSTRILTIMHSKDYYVVHEGKRFHWTEYYNDGFLPPSTE